MMSTTKPYTYLIGWSKLDLWYYGVRYAEGCHPGELWIRYFTSSSYVSYYRKQHGEPDVVQVRREFDSAEDAVRWEYGVLRRLKVVESKRWVNKSNRHWLAAGDSERYVRTKHGKQHSDETRNKISLANKGTVPWNKGIKLTEKECARQRAARLK